jgi:hypothetical protein
VLFPRSDIRQQKDTIRVLRTIDFLQTMSDAAQDDAGAPSVRHSPAMTALEMKTTAPLSVSYIHSMSGLRTGSPITTFASVRQLVSPRTFYNGILPRGNQLLTYWSPFLIAIACYLPIY